MMSSQPPPTLNGTHTTQESDELQDLANLRESKIEELMHENTELQNQLQAARLQVRRFVLISRVSPYSPTFSAQDASG